MASPEHIRWERFVVENLVHFQSQKQTGQKFSNRSITKQRIFVDPVENMHVLFPLLCLGNDETDIIVEAKHFRKHFHRSRGLGGSQHSQVQGNKSRNFWAREEEDKCKIMD